MDLEEARKLVMKYESVMTAAAAHTETAYRYYAGQNDIKFRRTRVDCGEEGKSLLRRADNRIAFNFHALLVDQKASYLFTAPPLFDLGSDEANQKVRAALGNAYGKKVKNLCVDASNAGVSWVHYWKDDHGNFQWMPIPAVQIYPIFTDDLQADLSAVMRCYKTLDDDGKEWKVYEFWNDEETAVYKKRDEIFLPFDRFSAILDGVTTPTNVYRHGLGAVPFVPFFNNSQSRSDLDCIKDLIDAYDKTFSGFVDDLEDIQEVILVLTNYGGTDTKHFLDDLKYYKTIQVDSTGDGDRSGVSTLTIDIPVEARDKLLELTRKAIFDMGQGVDPQQQSFDRTSGEAMKFMYSLLELKAGLMEAEFRLGLDTLIRAICRLSGITEPDNILQTWTRTAIRNDSELADMCSKAVGVLSTKTILKNHPFVDDPEAEEKELRKEKEASAAELEEYKNSFGKPPVQK